MPIFFLLSGYFFKDETIQDAAKKMFRSLIIPYFVVGIIMRLCQMTINVVEGNPFDYIDIISLFGVTWKLEKDAELVSVGAIWFLVVLFWSKLYLQVVLKTRYGMVLLILLANCSIFVTLVFGIILPFGIQQALVCALFVYAGSLCRKYGAFNRNVPTIPFMLLALSVIPFTMFFNVATRANGYGYGIINILISSCISIMLVIVLKKMCERKSNRVTKFFVWCGKFSIIILAVHSIEARYLCTYVSFGNWPIEILVRILYVLMLSYICVRFGLIRRVFNLKRN